jgi:Cys-rich four helix bundle protein (predicted Tat secretion target)
MATIGRRQLVTGGMAVAAGLALGERAAFAADAKAGLVDAAVGCVEAGEVCLEHCLAAFRSGDTTLGECATAVADMLPVCQALARLAASGSKRLPAYAAVCIQVCEDCEAACRKHEAHHAPCKACAEACARVIAALKQITAPA